MIAPPRLTWLHPVDGAAIRRAARARRWTTHDLDADQVAVCRRECQSCYSTLARRVGHEEARRIIGRLPFTVDPGHRAH